MKPSESRARPFLRKLGAYFKPKLNSLEGLLALLAQAHRKRLIHPQSLTMLEGVLRLSTMTAGDVMVAAPRMHLLDINADFSSLLNAVIRTGHSRFPVYEGSRDNIMGVLLAKDLLKRQRSPDIHLRALLRPTFFVPESKGLVDLLTELRDRRNHLALVVDEFGKTAGLITIEDILEEIVGEIEDEFDAVDGDAASMDIVSLPEQGAYRVSGQTALVKLIEVFDCEFAQADLEQFETIGGLVSHRLGHVPRKGEDYIVGGIRLVVLVSTRGVVKWFRVTRIA